MRIAKFLLLGLVAFAVASALAVYLYGRFAAQARGPSSTTLPGEMAATPLDRVFGQPEAERPMESGLRLVSDDIDAFAIRAHAARAAGRSLDLQYYYWRDDLTGGLLGREVLAAADRGVRVRILLDDINARGGDDVYLAYDSHPNIEVRLFNPALSRDNTLARGADMVLRAVTVTRRMHNKAWIADQRLAVVGGRNIGDAYFGASDTANFRDLDLAMVGHAVTQSGEIFDRFWNSPVVLPIRSLSDPGQKALSRLRARLEDLAASPEAELYLKRLKGAEEAARLLATERPFHRTEGVEVISDPPEKVLDVGQQTWLNETIDPVIASVTKNLEITSPYFIPGEEGGNLLHGLVERGARVTVLTNSLAATDVAAVHGAYAHYRESLLKSGIGLFELKAESRPGRISLFGSSNASLHTKAFTVDDHTGFIGSFNFDPRSIALNTEMGVLFRDAGLTAEVRQEFATHTGPTHAYRLTLDDGTLTWMAEPNEEPQYNEPGASYWRRLVATVTGFLPIESQL